MEMARGMGTEKAAVHDLAAAIADDLAIDWSHAVNQSSDREARSVVEQLRVIARIAGAHRNHPDSAETRVEPGPASAQFTARESQLPTPPAALADPHAGHLGVWGDLVLIE